jgi:hypothetical protein
MFHVSDVHAAAAAPVAPLLVASCHLHRVELDLDFDEAMRVLLYWPRERFLEPAPGRGAPPALHSTPTSPRYPTLITGSRARSLVGPMGQAFSYNDAVAFTLRGAPC